MTSDEIEVSLALIAESLERLVTVTSGDGEQLVALGVRVAELAEDVGGLAARIDRTFATASHVLAMKGATRTMTCTRCGTEYASEPGPPLCGPCWIVLGQPERYLESVPTTPTDREGA